MLEISDLKPGRTTGVVTMALTIHNQARELVWQPADTSIL